MNTAPLVAYLKRPHVRTHIAALLREAAALIEPPATPAEQLADRIMRGATR